MNSFIKKNSFKNIGFTIILLLVALLISFVSLNKKETEVRNKSVALVEGTSVTNVVTTRDTYVSKNQPNQSFGSQNTLKVRKLEIDQNTDHFVSYLHFDLRNTSQPSLVNRTVDCSGCRIILQLHTTDADNQAIASNNEYYIKVVRAMPYRNWQENSLTYNQALYKHPDTGQTLDENILVVYEYPIIHEFIAKNTTSVALENEYNASVISTGVNDESVIQIDLTDDLSKYLGYEFVIALESYRDFQTKPLEFYSKEASGKNPPSLIIQHGEDNNSNNFSEVTTLSIPEISDKTLITNNPYTALHNWTDSQQVNPNFTGTVDRYRRFQWEDLEPSMGVYDFSLIQERIDDLPEGGKFAFRVRMMRDVGNVLPTYLEDRKMSCTNSCNNNFTGVPDWDNEYLIERARLFVEALAEEFDGHPKIAWVDLGMFGRFGEWNCGCAETVTDTAILEEYVDMFTDTFRNTQLVLRTGSEYAYVYATSLPENNAGFKVGTRLDGYGYSRNGPNTSVLHHYELWKAFDKSWKVAPSLGEFFGTGDSGLDPNVVFYKLCLREIHLNLQL